MPKWTEGSCGGGFNSIRIRIGSTHKHTIYGCEEREHRRTIVQNSCILNIFIETISIYILGLRRTTTHLIDAIQKNIYIYCQHQRCVRMCAAVVGSNVFAPRTACQRIFGLLQLSQIDSSPIRIAIRIAQDTLNSITKSKRVPDVVARRWSAARHAHHPWFFIRTFCWHATHYDRFWNFYCVKNHINKQFGAIVNKWKNGNFAALAHRHTHDVPCSLVENDALAFLSRRVAVRAAVAIAYN